MLSRHLYRIDEVRANFRYSLLKGNIHESCFWCLELLDTQLFLEALEDCAWAWLYGIGIYGLGFLENFRSVVEREEIGADEILELAYMISRWSKRDSSVGWLLEEGLKSGQPDFLVRKGEGNPVQMAIAQGKTGLAWALLRTRWGEPSMCRKDIQIPDFIAERFVWETRALSLLATCWSAKSETISVPPMPQELMRAIDEWKSLEGRRARRVYKIRSEAIQFGTKRSYEGNMETNIQEVRVPETALVGSPFWETVAEDMGGWKKVRRNDDIRMAFYDLYFPDDIPDEWSKVDQEKSHGYGLFVKTSSRLNQYNKQLRCLFTGLSVRGVQSWTVTKRATEETYAELYEKEQERWAREMNEWDLRPRKKKLCPKIGNA